jgi:hypothetical protein
VIVDVVVVDGMAQELGRKAVETITVEEDERTTHVYAVSPFRIPIVRAGVVARIYIASPMGHTIVRTGVVGLGVRPGNGLDCAADGKPLIVVRHDHAENESG